MDLRYRTKKCEKLIKNNKSEIINKREGKQGKRIDHEGEMIDGRICHYPLPR